MSEVSTKPYLIRAIHEWLTPYLAVAVDGRTMVPRSFVQDGQIVLNIGPDATQSLVMGNELIAFQARFGGVAQNISVPVGNVSAIYARENGHGMAFELASEHETEAEEMPELAANPADVVDASAVPDATAEPAKTGLRSHLKLVK